MVRFLCAAAIAIAALALGQRPVAAYEAPWCAVYGFGWAGEIWECQYRSVEECVPNVIAGNRGFCNPNPRYMGVQQKHSHPRRKHVRAAKRSSFMRDE